MPFSSQFAWRPEMGTQVLVIDKADLSRRRIYELPTFSYFHLGDAWSDGDDIRFDLCVHRDMDFAARGASEILNGVPLDGEPARPRDPARVVAAPGRRPARAKLGVIYRSTDGSYRGNWFLNWSCRGKGRLDIGVNHHGKVCWAAEFGVWRKGFLNIGAHALLNHFAG